MHTVTLSDVEFLITDWSGVISDDRRPVYEANQRMLERRKIKRLTFEEWLPRTAMSPREFMAGMGVHEDGNRLFHEYREDFARVTAEGMQPFVYPDAKLFCERMVGIEMPLSVVSAHPGEYLEREAHEYGVRPYLRTIAGSAKDKACEIQRLTVGMNLSHVAYIGDMTFDVIAAKTAGVISIGVATGYQTLERLAGAEPDVLVESLTELGEHFWAFA